MKINEKTFTIWLGIILLYKSQDLTRKTASLAAMARISAHETSLGHCFSISCLISSITLYPLKLKFAGEPFSTVFSLVESIRTDP